MYNGNPLILNIHIVSISAFGVVYKNSVIDLWIDVDISTDDDAVFDSKHQIYMSNGIR